MELSTNIPIPKSNHPIDYHSKIVAFGSCFTENMGAKFQYFKFQCTTNPFGILFHPLAIEKVIHLALSEKQFTHDDIFLHNERWHCFDAHSDLSHPDSEVLLQNLNDALQITKQCLKETSHCIITLGTAWVYEHKKSNDVVANCHKIPQEEFEKQLLSVTQIEESLQRIVEKIKKANPEITFIFTVSPVRHLKDGFIENQAGKSHLISALYKICNAEYFKEHLYYFPSYEIMMDELRDYRFYAQDMIHPNQTAIDYIWNRFSECFLFPEAQVIMKEVDAIQKGITHKPFNAKSDAHHRFLNILQEKIQSLQQRFPHISFYK